MIAFSRDGGDTWSNFQSLGDFGNRAQAALAYLGKGNLTIVALRWEPPPKTLKRLYSSDYGRTWASIAWPPTGEGTSFSGEGQAFVERDENGMVTKMMEIGYRWPAERGTRHAAISMFRRSTDGGRTWMDQVEPQEWQFHVPYKGKPYLRGTSEGTFVRAANGWLVAALRTDMPAQFFDQPHDDSMEGLGISISKDDGKT